MMYKVIFWLLFAMIAVSIVIGGIMDNWPAVFGWSTSLLWMLMFRSVDTFNDKLIDCIFGTQKRSRATESEGGHE